MSNTGIVILNYNDSETTELLIKKISNYNSLKHIVIVDNCSTDNSYEILKSLSNEKIRVIKSLKNGGYSYGNNFGAKFLIDQYNVDIIFIANPDVLFEESFVTNILDIFETEDYTMLSGIMCDSLGRETSLPAWRIASYSDDLIDCFILPSKLKRKLMKKIDYCEPIVDVEALPGSLFAIKAQEFVRIDYFDEGTFLYCEERILGRRLMDNGFKVGIVTDLRYLHNHGSSTTKNFRLIEIRKMLFKSRLYYQKKYNEISFIKAGLLSFIMRISIVEYALFLRIRKILK